MTTAEPKTLTEKELNKIKHKFQLKYSSKSIIEKNRIVDKLIDTILEMESKNLIYSKEDIQIKKLEAQTISEMLIRRK